MKRSIIVSVVAFMFAFGSDVAEAGWCKDCQFVDSMAFCSLVTSFGWRSCIEGYGMCGPWGCVETCRTYNSCLGAV